MKGFGCPLRLLLIAAALLKARSAGAVNVLTQHNDNARTGANLSETVLTTTNLNVSQFGKLWSYPVTGQVYAQPLHVEGVTIGGVARNVLYVATMHNVVYAFDADSPGAAIWSVSLGPSVPLPTSSLGTTGPCPTYQDIQGEIGIMSTPVIDPASGTLYVEAKTFEGGAYIDRIHALDILSGAEKMGGPVAITASVSGTQGARTLDSLRANQRAALLLSSGRVYVAFASYCDSGPYYGWLFAYSAANLAQAPLVYTSVQDGSQAGIWMSGGGPSADDAGNVYLTTGNGSFNGDTGGRNLGNSFIKLNSSLGVLDWFTPYNWANLNSMDADLGSAGALLIPGTSLIVSGGKEGKIYLVNANNMGHYLSGSDSQIVQSFMSSSTHLHGSPVHWMGPVGALVYVGAESDFIKGYRLTGGLFATSPFTQTAFKSPSGAMPGSILAVSANASAAGSGILWANMSISQDANHATVPGVLRAFDASNLSIELWNSQQNAARDSFGNLAKFCAPTIANGKVFLGTFSNQVAVYGLLGAPTPTPTATTAGTPTPTPVGSADLALNKPATASSVENTGTTANLAVDGNTTTRWGSAFTDPQWIMVDLGATTFITRVRLNWEAAYGKTYQIQTSNDNATWTTIKDVPAGAGGIEDWTGLTGSGRYVRMYGTARGTAWGYSLWELEAYGSTGSATATSTPTPTATAAPRATATPTATATVAATATARTTATPTTATSSLRLQYKAAETAASTSQIKPHINILNGGTDSVPLSELTVRYWYTVDGDKSQNYFCDYAVLGCGNVTGAVVKLASAVTGADYYLEVRFAAGAGSISAGGQSGEIQNRLAKADWTNYNQANDYSFDATKTAFADWTRVALYRNGLVVWGTEPGAVATATTPPTATATARPTATAAPTASATATVPPTATSTGRPTSTATSTATARATPSPTASTSSLRVQYKAAETVASVNQIKPHLNIVNSGPTSVPLSELTVRYWYTINGDKAQNYFCDYAVVGCANVTGAFVKLASAVTGADYYLEVRFAAGAGSILAGGQSGEIQNRFAKADWTNYNQADDYSFDPTKTAFADWTRVTLYRSGSLVWGTEPF
jgi:hypothetical protein